MRCNAAYSSISKAAALRFLADSYLHPKTVGFRPPFIWETLSVPQKPDTKLSTQLSDYCNINIIFHATEDTDDILTVGIIQLQYLNLLSSQYI